MPSYTFIDEQGEEETHILSMSQLDDFKSEHPHLKQKLVAPRVIGGVTSEGGKLPEGFKDVLREMKKKHPKANGINQV